MLKPIKFFVLILGFLLTSLFWVACERKATTPEGEAEKDLTPAIEEQADITIIKGNVRLPGKKSASGIMVFASGTSILAFTDDNGDFSLVDLPAGEYDFFAQKPGYKTASLGKIKIEAPGTIVLQSIVLEELPQPEEGLSAIIGTVELEGSTDFSNVIVEIEEQLIRTVTDESGVYFIPNLSPGLYKIKFKKSGYKSEETSLEVKTGPRPTNAPRIRLALTLKPPGKRAIYGNVEMYDAQGQPQNKFASVIIGLEGTTYLAVPDSQGKFSLLDLLPNNYTITAAAPGFVNRNKIDVDLINLPYTNVTVVLDEDTSQKKGGGSIHGKVILADGIENLSGITVGLLGTNIVALTQENGEFTINDVAAGSYALLAKLEGYVPVKMEPVSVYANETTEVGEIKLERYIEPPVVLFTQPADRAKNVSVKRDIPVFVWFSKKMRPDSVKRAVSLTPDIDYQLFAGKEHPQSDFDILLILLKGADTENPAKFNTTYRIQLSTAAQDFEGATLEEPYEFRFTTGEAEIIDTYPRQGEKSVHLGPRTPAAIFFNAPIDHATLNESNIRLQPETLSRLDIYYRNDPTTGWTTARIRTAWDYDTDYTLTIGRGVRTVDGSYISNTPYVLRFRTAKLYEYQPLTGEGKSE